MPAGPTRGELASLLDQLTEQKTQVERLLGKVENVLRGAKFSGKAGRAALTAANTAQARKSSLD